MQTAENGVELKVPCAQLVEFMSVVGQAVPAGQNLAQAGSLRFHEAAIVHSTTVRLTTPVVETNTAAS